MPIRLIAGVRLPARLSVWTNCRRCWGAGALAADGRQLDELVGLASSAHKRGEPGLQALAENACGPPLEHVAAEALLALAGQAQAKPDPELITVKGQRLIRSCPVILYAGSLVPASCSTATAPSGW